MLEQNVANQHQQKVDNRQRVNQNLTEGSHGAINENTTPETNQISVNIFNSQLFLENNDEDIMENQKFVNRQQLHQQKVNYGSQVQMVPESLKQKKKGAKTPKNNQQTRNEQPELKLKINISPNDILINNKNNNSPTRTLGIQSSVVDKTISSKQGAKDEFNISDISIQQGFPAIANNDNQQQVQGRSRFRQRARGTLGPQKIPNITGFTNLPKAKKTPNTNFSHSTKMSIGLQKAFDTFQLPYEVKPQMTKKFQKGDNSLGLTQNTKGFDEIESSLASKRNDTLNDQFDLDPALRSAHAFFSPQNQNFRNLRLNNKEMFSQTVGQFFPSTKERTIQLQQPKIKTPFINIRPERESLQKEMIEHDNSSYQAHSSIHPINSKNIHSRKNFQDDFDSFQHELSKLKEVGSNTIAFTTKNSMKGRRYTTQVEPPNNQHINKAANHDLQQIRLRVHKNQGKRANSNVRSPAQIENISVNPFLLDRTSDPALNTALHKKTSPRNFHESIITHIRKKALIQKQMSPYQTSILGHNLTPGATSNPGIQHQIINQMPQGKLNFKKLLSSTLQNIANTSQTSIYKHTQPSPLSSYGESELLAAENSGAINISPAPILTFNTNQQSKIKIIKDVPTEWSARDSPEQSQSPSNKLLQYNGNFLDSQTAKDYSVIRNAGQGTEESPAKTPSPKRAQDGSEMRQTEDQSSMLDAISNLQPAIHGVPLALNTQLKGAPDTSQQISIKDLSNEEFTNQLQQYNDNNLSHSLAQSQQRQIEQQITQLYGQKDQQKSTLMTNKIQNSDEYQSPKGEAVGQLSMDEHSKSLASYESENSKGSPRSLDKKRSQRKSKLTPGESPHRRPSKIEQNRKDTVSGKVSDQLIQLKLLDHQASTTQQQLKTQYKVNKALKGKKLRTPSKPSRDGSSRMSKQDLDITHLPNVAEVDITQDLNRFVEEFGPQSMTSREKTNQTVSVKLSKKRIKSKDSKGIKHYEDSITRSIEEEDFVSKTFSKRSKHKRNDSSNEDIKEVMELKEKLISPQFGKPGQKYTLLTPPTPKSALPQSSPKIKLQLETSNHDIIDSLYVDSPDQLKSPNRNGLMISEGGVKSKLSQLSPLSFTKKSPRVTIKQERVELVQTLKQDKGSRSPQQYQCIPIKVWDCKSLSNASKIQMKQYSRKASPVETSNNSQTPVTRRKQPLQFQKDDSRNQFQTEIQRNEQHFASFQRKQAPQDNLFVIEDEEKASQVILSKVDPASEEKQKQETSKEQKFNLQNEQTMSFENIAIRKQVGPNVQKRESIPLNSALNSNNKQSRETGENLKDVSISEEVSPQSPQESPQSPHEDTNFNSDFIIQGMESQDNKKKLGQKKLEYAHNNTSPDASFIPKSPQQLQSAKFNTSSSITQKGQHSHNNSALNETNINKIFDQAFQVNLKAVQNQSQRPFQDNADTSQSPRQSSKQQSQFRVQTNPTIVNMNSDILPVQANSKMTEESSKASIAQTPARQLRFPKSKLKNQRGSNLINKIQVADSSEIIPVGLNQGTHVTDQSQNSIQVNPQQAQPIHVKTLMIQQQSNRKNIMYGSEHPSDTNFASTQNDVLMAPAVLLGTMSQSKARSPPKLPVTIQQNIKIKPQILNESEFQSQKKHQNIKVVGKKAQQSIQHSLNTSKQKQIVMNSEIISKDEEEVAEDKRQQEFGNNTQGSQDYFMHLDPDSQMADYADFSEFSPIKMASLQHENGELTQTMKTKNNLQTENSRVLDIEQEQIELEQERQQALNEHPPILQVQINERNSSAENTPNKSNSAIKPIAIKKMKMPQTTGGHKNKKDITEKKKTDRDLMISIDSNDEMKEQKDVPNHELLNYHYNSKQQINDVEFDQHPRYRKKQDNKGRRKGVQSYGKRDFDIKTTTGINNSTSSIKAIQNLNEQSGNIQVEGSQVKLKAYEKGYLQFQPSPNRDFKQQLQKEIRKLQRPLLEEVSQGSPDRLKGRFSIKSSPRAQEESKISKERQELQINKNQKSNGRKKPTLNRDLVEYQIMNRGSRTTRGDVSGLAAQGMAVNRVSRQSSIEKTRVGVFSKTITNATINNGFQFLEIKGVPPIISPRGIERITPILSPRASIAVDHNPGFPGNSDGLSFNQICQVLNVVRPQNRVPKKAPLAEFKLTSSLRKPSIEIQMTSQTSQRNTPDQNPNFQPIVKGIQNPSALGFHKSGSQALEKSSAAGSALQKRY